MWEVDKREQVRFDVGEAEEVNVCVGIEQATQKMSEGERARLTLASSAGYGSAGNSNLGVPANTALVYEVELVKIDNVKESWDMSVIEKLEAANLLKSKGTKYVQKNNWAKARAFYERAETCVSDEYDFKEDLEKDQRKAALLALYLNIALCHLKLKEFGKAIEFCDKALESDRNSDKAYFRRGLAREGLGDLEEARAAYKKALNIAPNNKAVRSSFISVQKRIKLQYECEKKTFYGMFDKFAAEDAKNQVRV